jgi:hypothetical protein
MEIRKGLAVVLRAKSLVLDVDTVFDQSGGNATFGSLQFSGRNSMYMLSGGSLTIRDELRGGTIDFAKSAASLVIGDGAILDLEQVKLMDPQAGTLNAGIGSLIVTTAEKLMDVSRDGRPGQIVGNYIIDFRTQVSGE